MKNKYLILTFILIISSSLTYASKTLLKGTLKDEVQLNVDKGIGKWGDDKYTYELELTGVDRFVCMSGTIERLTTYESKEYVAKFQNPEAEGWCYFFAKGKTPQR